MQTAALASISPLMPGEIIAIDGKTLRRSHDRAKGLAALHLVSREPAPDGLGQPPRSVVVVAAETGFREARQTPVPDQNQGQPCPAQAVVLATSG